MDGIKNRLKIKVKEEKKQRTDKRLMSPMFKGLKGSPCKEDSIIEFDAMKRGAYQESSEAISERWMQRYSHKLDESPKN